MHIMAVQAVLVVFVLFATTAKSEAGDITIWKKNVTLTCPGNGKWYKKEGEPLLHNGTTYNFEYKGKVLYYCVYTNEVENPSPLLYHFYVEAKVCENCFEMDAFVFGLALIADLVLTIFVMMIVYKYTEKKSSAEPPRSSRARGHSGGQAPPTPSPDYAPLNPHTRSQGVYSTVVNRTG